MEIKPVGNSGQFRILADYHEHDTIQNALRRAHASRLLRGGALQAAARMIELFGDRDTAPARHRHEIPQIGMRTLFLSLHHMREEQRQPLSNLANKMLGEFQDQLSPKRFDELFPKVLRKRDQ